MNFLEKMRGEPLKLTKKDFDPGPFSCWLREELLGEVYPMEFNTRGIVTKLGVKVYDSDDDIIMNFHGLDDLPDRLRRVAVEIIRAELDPGFER